MCALMLSSDTGNNPQAALIVNGTKNKGTSLLPTVTIEKPKIEIKLNE